MAAISKAVHVGKTLNNVVKLLTNLSFKTETASVTIPICNGLSFSRYSFIHTTSTQNDTRNLMQFFDDEKNWGKLKVQVGRAWKLDELRIKSNEDLHKLWYILLKERNMLLTMEEQYKRKHLVLPNEERMDKVEISMENVETVVRERNKAYHLLETGESGERPAKNVKNQIGLPYVHRMRQYAIPKFMNTKWRKANIFINRGFAVKKFLRLYKEKFHNERRRERTRREDEVIQICRQYPNVDLEAVKAKYPDVDVDSAILRKPCRGHFIPSWYSKSLQ